MASSNAEIAARHHQRVGKVDDLIEPQHRLRFLDLGHHGGAARVIFLASAMSSGRCTKDSPIQSMPASSAASRSNRSFGVSAETG
jgi:hypothetical protein